jgi:acyl carrier protein
MRTTVTDNLRHMEPIGSQQPFEQEIARLLVETLQLEMDPRDIVPDHPLFNEGLGLDSIDALELALVIGQNYGIELKSDDERNSQIFASLRSLAHYIAMQRTR